MKPYIFTILTSSLLAVVIELLSPRGEGGRIASHVRMITGLFLVVTLLQPIREGILFLQSAADGGLTDRLEEMVPDEEIPHYEQTFLDTLTDVGARETEVWVVSALETVFHISPDGCVVEAVCDAEEERLVLKEVRISLNGAYVWENPHPIETYISEQLKCPCYVTIHP